MWACVRAEGHQAVTSGLWPLVPRFSHSITVWNVKPFTPKNTPAILSASYGCFENWIRQYTKMVSMVGTIFSNKYLHFRKLPQAGMRRMDGEARPGTEMSYAGSDLVRKEWESDHVRDSVNQGKMVKCEGAEWTGLDLGDERDSKSMLTLGYLIPVTVRRWCC